LVNITDLGVHFDEDGEEAENVEEHKILNLSVEGGVLSPSIIVVHRKVVGADFEEEGGISQ
jgi:hypothetical protein